MESKKKAIERVRMKSGFLPRYSEYYFKSGEAVVSVIVTLLVMCTGMSIIIMSVMPSRIRVVMTVVMVALWAYFLGIRRIIDSIKKVQGFQFEEDCITKDFGVRSRISYGDIEDDIKNGHMKYGKYGIVIGKGYRRLEFHYELGATKSQLHVQECYEILKKHIVSPLLPYKEEYFKEMDSLDYYKRSTKTASIVLLIAMIVFGVMIVPPWNEQFTGVLVGAGAIVAIMIGCLYVMFKNALLTSKCLGRIKDKTKEFTNMKFEKGIKGYVHFGICVLIVVAWNLWSIFRNA